MSEQIDNGTDCSSILVSKVEKEVEITNGEAVMSDSVTPTSTAQQPIKLDPLSPDAPPPGFPPQPTAPPQPPPSSLIQPPPPSLIQPPPPSSIQLPPSSSIQPPPPSAMTPQPTCRDFQRGNCTRLNCSYIHVKELQFCHDFQNSKCIRKNCKYLHRSVGDEIEYKRTGKLPEISSSVVNDKVAEEASAGTDCFSETANTPKQIKSPSTPMPPAFPPSSGLPGQPAFATPPVYPMQPVYPMSPRGPQPRPQHHQTIKQFEPNSASLLSQVKHEDHTVELTSPDNAVMSISLPNTKLPPPPLLDFDRIMKEPPPLTLLTPNISNQPKITNAQFSNATNSSTKLKVSPDRIKNEIDSPREIQQFKIKPEINEKLIDSSYQEPANKKMRFNDGNLDEPISERDLDKQIEDLKDGLQKARKMMLEKIFEISDKHRSKLNPAPRYTQSSAYVLATQNGEPIFIPSNQGSILIHSVQDLQNHQNSINSNTTYVEKIQIDHARSVVSDNHQQLNQDNQQYQYNQLSSQPYVEKISSTDNDRQLTRQELIHLG